MWLFIFLQPTLHRCSLSVSSSASSGDNARTYIMRRRLSVCSSDRFWSTVWSSRLLLTWGEPCRAHIAPLSVPLMAHLFSLASLSLVAGFKLSCGNESALWISGVLQGVMSVSARLKVQMWHSRGKKVKIDQRSSERCPRHKHFSAGSSFVFGMQLLLLMNNHDFMIILH